MSSSFEIKVKKLAPEAIMPQYANPDDAGFDVFALEKTTIPSREWMGVGTGLSIEIPTGYVSLVWDKSGLALKQGLKTAGGVIDSGYRGEYVIILHNLGAEEIIIRPGQKIAQVLIQPVIQAKFVLSEELSTSERSAKGFGSTGI